MNNSDTKNLNVVFAGCARDCEPFLKDSRFYNKVERKIFYRNKLLNFKENLIIKKILRSIN